MSKNRRVKKMVKRNWQQVQQGFLEIEREIERGIWLLLKTTGQIRRQIREIKSISGEMTKDK